MGSASGVNGAESNRETLAEAAFLRRLPEFMALAADEVVVANLDVTTAIGIALGAKVKLDAARDEFIEHLRHPELTLIDALEDHAWALHHAQGRYQIAVTPVYCPAAKLEVARLLRQTLLRSLQALEARGAVNPARWKALRPGRSRVNLAMDLNILAQVHMHYAEHGRDTDGTPIEQGLAASTELALALDLSKLILAAFGRRNSKPEIAAAEDMRNRVFTKLLRSYDEGCRCMTYVYWHHDEGNPALPSLWHQRRRKRARSAEKAAGDPPVTEASSAALSGAVPSTPGPRAHDGAAAAASGSEVVESTNGPFLDS